MKGDGASDVRDMTVFAAALSQAIYAAKKVATQVVQIALDISIYLISLELALRLRTSTQAGFLAERKLFFCGVVLVCFYFHGLYQLRTWMFWDETREVLKATGAVLLIILAFLFAMRFQLSRVAIVVSFMFFVPSCIVARYLFRRTLFSMGLQKTPILVIGAGKTGELYAQKVSKHSFMGCEIRGFLDDDPQKKGTKVAGIPVLGSVSDFQRVQRDLNVSEVVVAISTASRELLAHILETVEMRVKRVSYIPDMYMLTTFSASIRDVDGVPLISASQGLLNPWNRMLKGVMDYVGALLALIVFSPVFLYAAWKTKRDDGGKVFFQHERVGRNLISFKMYKFSEDNPRITKADKSSRKMNLDEIPRIFNVLRGEMSLIGPCPTIKREVELYYGEETARQIFRVKPGVTGFWQVSGRNDVPDYQSRIDLDLYYIHNWSLWLDIIILFRTARMLIDAHRAY